MPPLTRPTRRSAFTLTELVIVIVVLGILTAVAVPKFTDFGESSKEALTRQGLAHLRGYIHNFQMKTAIIYNGTPRNPSTPQLRYFLRGKKPVNPYSPIKARENRILRISSGTANADLNTGGWAYDQDHGVIWANSMSGAGEETW